MEKARREELGHDVRGQDPLLARAREVDEQDDLAGGKASFLWRALARPGTREEESVAAKGTRGTPRELPYRGELEAQLGTDLSHVKSFVDEQATERLGAEAYATPDGIVFGNANPAKDLVAHEVVHMHQQRGTGAVSEDEAEADAIGDRLARGDKVGKGEIKSGGGKVRKKEKQPTLAETSLLDAFLLLARSVERTGTAIGTKQGSGVELEGNKLEAKSKTFEHGGASAQKGSAASTLQLNGAGLRVGTEQKLATGSVPVANQVPQMQATIEAAKQQIAGDAMWGYVESLKLDARKAQIESELAKLSTADETLVAGKQLALFQEHADIAKRQKQLDGTLVHQKAMLGKLEEAARTLATGDKANAALVAERLAKAEIEFQKATELTVKRSFGFDMLAGTVDRTHEVSNETVGPDGKSTVTGTTSSQKLALGGGITGESTNGTINKAADGTVTTSGTSTTGQLVVKDDGTVGLGGGMKLSDSTEKSFDKTTSATGFKGAVTTNIIAIPKQNPKDKNEPQLYAVVVSINLGLATQIGRSKSWKTEDGSQDKLRAGVDVKANVEAQVTQTHVLDAATAQQYLTELEAAGSGDKAAAGKKPEFTLLQKALAGEEGIEQMSAVAQAALTDGKLADTLKVGDSTEITLKAGAGIDGSLGSGPVGATGGGRVDGFRTLKIGRVRGAAGNELLELTVSFGKSGDIHGALTASALGIGAGVGGKMWGSDENVVTFQLDEQLGDYDSLYGRIVRTSSLDELVMLRNSDAFSKHVLAWSQKSSHGSSHEGSLSVGPVKLGMGVANDRSSMNGIDRNGKLSVAESGSTTDSYSGALGPLELLKSSHKDTATYSVKDDVRMLDLANLDEFSTVGQFEMPSLTGLLAAESPAKALEKAVLVNRKHLSGFMLDPYDIEELAKRADHQAAWVNVPVHADVITEKKNIAAWNVLGEHLRTPAIDPKFASLDPDLAREVARGTAVAEFFSGLGHAKGNDYMRIVLREYHEAGGDGTDIGHAYEFPASIDQSKYIELRYKWRGLDKKLASFLPEGEAAAEKAVNYCTDLQADIAVMIDSLQKATDFKVERSRVEMIGEMRKFLSEIPAKRRDFLRTVSGTSIVTEDQLAKDDASDAKTKVRHLEATVGEAKHSERRLLGRASNGRKEHFRGDRFDIGDALIAQLEQLYEIYVPMVKELRAAYLAAGTEPAARKVRDNAKLDERDYDIDIDGADGVLQLYYGNGTSAGRDTVNTDYNKHSIRWERDLHCF